jgi:hypothetical protein
LFLFVDAKTHHDLTEIRRDENEARTCKTEECAMSKAKVVNAKKSSTNVVNIDRIAAEKPKAKSTAAAEPKMGARKYTIKLAQLSHKRAVAVAKRLAGTALHKQAAEIARLSAELAERAEDLSDDYRAPSKAFDAGQKVTVKEALTERYSALLDLSAPLTVVRTLDRRTIVQDASNTKTIVVSSHLEPA